MNNILKILGGIGVGAALMYLYDPKDGNQRRALIRDKAVGLTNDAREAISRQKDDLSNRAQGLLHEAKAQLSGKSEAAADNRTT